MPHNSHEHVRDYKSKRIGDEKPAYEHQMDRSLISTGYEFTKAEDKFLNGWSQGPTYLSFALLKPSLLLTQVTTGIAGVFDIARMTSRTYRGKSRSFIGEHENENERHGDWTFYNNYQNADIGNSRYLENTEISQPYSINTVHLQNPYKAPEKLEGFGSRITSHKVRSRFIQKGLQLSRDSNFRTRTNNIAVTRREISTVDVRDVDDDKAVRINSRRKAICMCLNKISLGETAKQYCSNSSLHGLRYIGDATLTTVEKLFWLIAFVIAVLASGYFIQHLYEKWVSTPIIISLSPESVAFEEFPFPSVTVCNMNNVKKTEANRINRGDDKLDKLLLEDLCDFQNNTANEDEAYGSANWTNVLRFMINVSQPCTDMLSVCQWHGNITECERIFNPTMTDEGICCNFNSVHRNDMFYNPREWSALNITFPFASVDWNPEKGYDKSDPVDAIPWRPYGAGKYYGLTLVLDTQIDEYYCSSTASVGFKILLHNPVETPKIADFAFAVNPGQETRVVIKPQITSASNMIRAVPKQQRKCFFTAERRLRYYRTYTQKNCVLECEANFTQKLCHCVQYYMPKSQNTPICGKKDDLCATSARRAMEFKLYDEEITVNQLNITETPISCNCWPGCFEMNYETGMSSSQLGLNFNVDELYLKKSPEYFAKNMAVVHLYFVDSQFPKYVKSELFGFIEFLSNTGGLLGLFMGFSFISLAEIFYFITLRLWCRLRGNHKSPSHSVIHVSPANHGSRVIYPFAQ